MKPLLVVALTSLGLSVICLAAAGAMSDDWDDVNFRPWQESAARLTDEDRTVIEREVPWDGGDELSINVPAEVTYSYAETPRLIARGPAYIVNDLMMYNGDIHAKHRRKNGGNLKLTITAPSVESFSVKGASQLKLNDLNQDKLVVSIAGAAEVDASGTVREVVLSIAGASDADFSDLKVKKAKVSIAGIGDVKIAPTDEADISIAGAGDVDLLTRPARLTTHIAGAGDISQPDPEDAPKSEVTVGVGETKSDRQAAPAAPKP